MGYLTVVVVVVVVMVTKDVTARNVTKCGGPLTGSSGTFRSPVDVSHPRTYPNRAYCNWSIAIPYDSTLSITFTKFKTEGCCDYLRMTTDERKLIGQFSGLNTPPLVSVMSVETSRVDIVFYSDDSVPKEGFTALYSIQSNTVPTGVPKAGTTATSNPTATSIPAATSTPATERPLMRTFQKLSSTLSRIIYSSSQNLLGPGPPNGDSISAFRSDLFDSLRTLETLKSVESTELTHEEQQDINSALKQLNVKAKDLVRKLFVQISSSVCQLPPKTGPCRGYFPRWYYHTQQGTCGTFIYGGCKSNGNNFHTREACNALCGPQKQTGCNMLRRPCKVSGMLPLTLSCSDKGKYFTVNKVFIKNTLGKFVKIEGVDYRSLLQQCNATRRGFSGHYSCVLNNVPGGSHAAQYRIVYKCWKK